VIAHDRLEELGDVQAVDPVVLERTRQNISARHDDDAQTYRDVRSEIVRLQVTELNRLYRVGAVSDSVRRKVQRELDIEAERFNG